MSTHTKLAQLLADPDGSPEWKYECIIALAEWHEAQPGVDWRDISSMRRAASVIVPLFRGYMADKVWEDEVRAFVPWWRRWLTPHRASTSFRDQWSESERQHARDFILMAWPERPR